MRAAAAAVVIVVAFASLSMTFLVAPLAVLIVFYVVYASVRSGGSEGTVAVARATSTPAAGSADPAPRPLRRRPRLEVSPPGADSGDGGRSTADRP